MKYTLLELIDNPSRIKNVKYNEIFDYVLESLESFDRFEVFIKILEKYYNDIYMGFVYCASDIYPIKDIFANTLKESNIKQKNLDDGSSLNVLWGKINSLFVDNTINNEQAKYSILDFISIYYFDDIYLFAKDVLQQRDHNKLYEAFKKLYFANKLATAQTLQYFSFGYRNRLKNTEYTRVCIPVKNVEKLLCIGKVLYNDKMENVTSKYQGVINQMLSSTRDFTSNGTGKTLKFDFITYVYTSNGNTIMYQNLYGFYLPLNIRTYQLTDNEFSTYIINGAEMIICLDKGKIVSIISEESGVLEKKVIHTNKVNYFRLNSMFGAHINCLVCSGENMEDTVVYVPDHFILDNKESYTLQTYKFRNQYFLRKVVEDGVTKD